eukprot:546562-Alexandrium_andersonii.AAC.1
MGEGSSGCIGSARGPRRPVTGRQGPHGRELPVHQWRTRFLGGAKDRLPRGAGRPKCAVRAGGSARR